MSDPMEKLEPCPFCGGEAVMLMTYATNDPTRYMVGCDFCEDTYEMKPMETEELATAAWNERKPIASLTADLTAARERIAELEGTQQEIIEKVLFVAKYNLAVIEQTPQARHTTARSALTHTLECLEILLKPYRTDDTELTALKGEG